MKLAAPAAPRLCSAGADLAEAKTLACATRGGSHRHPGLGGAAGTDRCGAGLRPGRPWTLYNRFQTVFNKELRRSDAMMLSMFKRLNGARAGNAAYDAYKTRAIAHAEQRRTMPGAAADFCRTADIVFAAALAPDKPVLEDFVAGVPVDEANPVDSCEIKVAVALQGVAAGPDIAPTPRPDLPGDPPNPNLFPQSCVPS